MTIKNWLTIKHHENGKTTDVWLAKRRVLRLTTRRAGIIYGPVTVLRATRGGGAVLRDADRWTRFRTICGVLLCTGRGSVMAQWRGFDADGR